MVGKAGKYKSTDTGPIAIRKPSSSGKLREMAVEDVTE
jgi:hypothetical protein